MPIHNETDTSLIASVIGELRTFAAQQSTTNLHMLEELKKISDRMAAFAEVGATFVEYRKTLHERFGQIHLQISDIDIEAEQLQSRVVKVEMQIAMWRSNWKLLVSAFMVVSTLLSAIVSNYGTAILRAVLHPN